eukprot:768177-Hanusia_phi.AAC.5
MLTPCDCSGLSLIAKGPPPRLSGMAVLRRRFQVYGDPVFHPASCQARLFRSYRARLGLAALFAEAARYATFS